jgi:hypothetical protein
MPPKHSTISHIWEIANRSAEGKRLRNPEFKTQHSSRFHMPSLRLA